MSLLTKAPRLRVSWSTAGSEQGQAILEYILLMVVSIGIAAIIMKTLVSRNPDNPGAILNRWNAIITEIGKDDPNKTK